MAWLDGTSTGRTAAELESYVANRRVFDVESPAYGAVADEFFTDGVATSSSTTFTSATANFTSSDVGKTIVILRAGPSNFQDHHTTISSVTNSTTVVLANSAGRSQSDARFYVSRGGDQTTAIQAAIDDAAADGGGVVLLPGVGYLASQLVLGNRVVLRGGAGRFGTFLHQIGQANKNFVTNDQTTDNSAMNCMVMDMWVDGNRQRQSNISTTLNGAYTAGSGTITLTDASNFQNAGYLTIGSSRYFYQSKSGNTLSGVVGGVQDTTDSSQSNGASVTQSPSVISFGVVPYNSNPTTAEQFDGWFGVYRAKVKNSKGNCIENFGQSEMRVIDVWVHYATLHGVAPSFDSWLADVTADTCGEAGYYMRSSDVRMSNCKAFYCGGNVAANGHGFWIDGKGSSDVEGTKALAACSAQDNKAHGFYIKDTNRVMLFGMTSSNSTSSAGTYVGVCLDGSRQCIIDVVSTDRVSSPNSTQQNAIEIKATNRDPWENQIRVTHGAAASASVGAAVKSGSVFTDGQHVTVNGQGSTLLSGNVSGTYTTSPYTATTHVMTLTGNVTFAAPTEGHPGCVLRFVMAQNGTGGHTMTFNAAFKTSGTSSALVTTASKTNVIEFVFDGTSWFETARTVNI